MNIFNCTFFYRKFYDLLNSYDNRDISGLSKYINLIKNSMSIDEYIKNVIYVEYELGIPIFTNFSIMKDMHNKDVYHGDVFSKNLMINKYYDIKLIDLDMMIIDDYVSPENVFMYEQDYHNDIEYAKEKNIKEDKLGIIYMYMRYLLNGRFEGNLKDDLTALKLPKTIEQEIQSIMNGKSSIKKEYYLEDIIDDLIDKNYTAPVLQRRKGK